MKQKSQIEQRRETFVVKSNDLIQRTTYMLTTSQQKILLYMISFVKPEDEKDKIYTYSIRDFAKVAGLDLNGGSYYPIVKDNILALTQKSWALWIDDDGEETENTMAWIENAQIKKKTGTVKIKFHESVAPYLFEIKEKYTKYSLENALAFKNKYTIRMYELFKSYERMKKVTFQVDRLREMMRATEKYPLYGNFKQKVIDVCIKEINNYARDIKVELNKEIKRGRRVYELEFSIMSKLPRTPEDQETGERVTARLDKHMSQHNGKLNE